MVEVCLKWIKVLFLKLFTKRDLYIRSHLYFQTQLRHTNTLTQSWSVINFSDISHRSTFLTDRHFSNSVTFLIFEIVHLQYFLCLIFLSYHLFPHIFHTSIFLIFIFDSYSISLLYPYSSEVLKCLHLTSHFSDISSLILLGLEFPGNSFPATL